MRKLSLPTISFVLLFACFTSVGAETPPASNTSDAVGEIFGHPVSRQAFQSADLTMQIFSLGRNSRDAAERRSETWRHLIFLEEANRRGISIPQPEVESELQRLFAEKNMAYGSYAYYKWVTDNFKETPADFEKRVAGLLTVKLLVQQLLDPATPAAEGKQEKPDDVLARAALKDYTQTKKEVGQGKLVTFETSAGSFEVRLYDDAAPKACENFIGLAEKGYYDGTEFHRVIKGFMIQGGDPTATGRGGQSLWGEPFADEVTPMLRFDREGLLAMANSGPNTNGSQFFITLGAPRHLDGKHTIFGEVTKGFDVVRRIGDASTGPADKPVEKQAIRRVLLNSVA